MAKLNAQGLARRDEKLLRTIKPNVGNVVISADLGQGEPTVTTHYSGDANYRAASFDMLGKRPFYDNSGLLQISDIYLMTMSKSPMGAKVLKDAFNKDWNGKTFSEQWVSDDEVIKKFLKNERQFHKILCLGISYSMGPKKMVNSSYEKGYVISLEDAKAFHRVYWDTFKDVKKFERWCTKKVETDGYIVNEFGYRCTPEPFKAFNALIQSTVSGIMHVFTRELMFRLPRGSRFITIIHDEVIYEIPEDRVEEARKAQEEATQALNDLLQWQVAIRTGFVKGMDWYEAK